MCQSVIIIFSIYERSFPQILGISFPRNFNEDGFTSLHDYVLRDLSESRRRLVESRLTNYRSIRAPAIKTAPLVQYLTRTNTSPKSLIDFGCGSEGYTINYLKTHLPTLQRVLGVDTHGPPAHRSQGHSSVIYKRTISEAKVTPGSCDLIMVIHTLHHIRADEQQVILNCLSALLSPRGLLYLYEDSWSSTDRRLGLVSDSLDDVFIRMSKRHKVEVFRQNDFWANKWSYSKEMETDRLRYRPIEEWEHCLAYAGIVVADSGVIGFDSRRLHGVPAGWLIGSKSQNI